MWDQWIWITEDLASCEVCFRHVMGLQILDSILFSVNSYSCTVLLSVASSFYSKDSNHLMWMHLVTDSLMWFRRIRVMRSISVWTIILNSGYTSLVERKRTEMGSELRFYLYLLTWGNLCNFSELVPLICNVAIRLQTSKLL